MIHHGAAEEPLQAAVISTMTPTRPKSEHLEQMLTGLSLDEKMDGLDIRQPRPTHPRSETHPTPSIFLTPQPQQASRNRSPYSRLHLRSHSGGTAPVMTRAHSSPGYITSSPRSSSPRSSSPLRSPARVRSPLLRPGSSEDSSPLSSKSSPGGLSDIGSISEDSELDLTPRAAGSAPFPNLSQTHSSNTFPRQRRRPASPLHQVSISSPSFGTPPASTSSGLPSLQSSPLPSPAKFNEPFPPSEPSAMRHYSSSYSLSSASGSSYSMPTTPTSVRSRSPSISSLETIPDSPDAEQAAEAETRAIARLKAAAEQQERQEQGESGDRFRRGSLDIPRGGGGGAGFGWPTGGRDKRKRWSVCGAERRGDLDLETIWED